MKLKAKKFENELWAELSDIEKKQRDILESMPLVRLVYWLGAEIATRRTLTKFKYGGKK